MRMNFLLNQVAFWWSSPLSSFSFWNWRLDIGEGKGVNLEKCSRVDLQWQCIKYLGPVSFIQWYIVSGFTFAFLIECKHIFLCTLHRFFCVILLRFAFIHFAQNEREAYEVIIDDGKLVYKKSGMFVNTCDGSKWIFVLSTSRALYVGQVDI